MLNRGQFTFYRSFWEAVRSLPKKDRLPILEAIISYALDGEVPQMLSSSQMAFFALVKPNLDTSRKRAVCGKQGGSKPQAKGKQTTSKKENEKENENEKEVEEEKDKEQSESTAPHSGKPFTAFWDAYPSKIDREGAWIAWKEINPDTETADQIIAALDAWKKSNQWTEDGGRFIPNAAKFLSKGYWRSPPLPEAQKGTTWGATGTLGKAEQEAIQRLLREG